MPNCYLQLDLRPLIYKKEVQLQKLKSLSRRSLASEQGLVVKSFIIIFIKVCQKFMVFFVSIATRLRDFSSRNFHLELILSINPKVFLYSFLLIFGGISSIILIYDLSIFLLKVRRFFLSKLNTFFGTRSYYHALSQQTLRA